jgi:hypothetical protein
VAWRGLTASAVTAVAVALSAQPAAAQQDALGAACASLSPIALPCVAGQKLTEALAATCRRAGVAEAQCTFPLAKRVTQAARDSYLRSWVHRAAQLQYALQDDLPLTRAQWIGTHNSFNSANDSPTVSHFDSNQQLSLRQQLDVDVRALEIDLHLINGRVLVCHGRGRDELHLGCTTEPELAAVLADVRAWLDAHQDQVLLLYLEDHVEDAAGYAQTLAALEQALGKRLFRPDAKRAGAKGCTPLPLALSRNAVRRAKAQVVLVGDCARGWAPLVFGWNDEHVEGGSTAAFQPFPACDATYKSEVYGRKLVRYYEDSTLVSAVIAPTTPPNDPERLSAQKVAAMTACGVNLFGLDQLLPDDGRLAATIWSWAENEPDAAHGRCTAQRADGRWARRPCTIKLRAACRRDGTWLLTTRPLTFDRARGRCRGRHAPLGVPRSGDENARLRALAGDAEVWINRASRAAS